MITQGDFDIDAVTRLRKLGGNVLVSRIANMFADFAAARVADAVAGDGQGDLLKVAAAAHAVRSSAANVGATRLLVIATELESAARTGETDIVPYLVTGLRRAFDGARTHVLGYVTSEAA